MGEFAPNKHDYVAHLELGPKLFSKVVITVGMHSLRCRGAFTFRARTLLPSGSLLRKRFRGGSLSFQFLENKVFGCDFVFAIVYYPTSRGLFNNINQ